MNNGYPLDSAGDLPVARIEIVMYQSGMIKVEGQITNKEFALTMIDSARETVCNYHARRKIERGDTVLIPGA
jgi:hypothetical protein